NHETRSSAGQRPQGDPRPDRRSRELAGQRHHGPEVTPCHAAATGRLAGWLTALDRAVGRGVQRKRAAAELLAEMPDLPEVADRAPGRHWLGCHALDAILGKG